MMKHIFFAFLLALSSPLLAQDISKFLALSWPNTNFEKTAVDLSEIISGGPGKDGIPAIDTPRFIAVAKEESLSPREPVMTVELEGEARAYPIRYLMWHEIVNDQIGSTPISVTYCPLCNSGIVFDRRLDNQLLDFGVSGNLRHSDMIMYDRQTESWWQQFLGEAVVGELTGSKLKKLPGWMESFEAFKTRNPEGQVMVQPNFPRQYGANPYEGYDGLRKPFLYNGEMPPHGIDPLARVVVVKDHAWPLTRFSEGTTLEEAGYILAWEGLMGSALDHRNIAKGRDVASIRVRDKEGNDVPHDVAFAFAFHAFHPDGQWMIKVP